MAPTIRLSSLLLTGLVMVAALVTACEDGAQQTRDTAPASRYTERELQARQRYDGATASGGATGDTERGAAFARWVLEQDQRGEYITEAVVRGDQVLGVKIRPGLGKAQLRELVTALGRGMADSFPGRALAVRVFDQAGEGLAEGAVDPRTGRIDVQLT